MNNKCDDPNYKDSQAAIIADEKEFLGDRPDIVNKNGSSPERTSGYNGLAISGGGIRSASFGLGVMQALVNNENQLEKIDFMSTVSGGGYLGSALTWALHQYPDAGTNRSNFPLGKKSVQGAKDQVIEDTTRPRLKGNELLNFIRLHGSYLTPTDKLDIVSFSGVVLRSMIISLTVYLSIFTIGMTLAIFSVYKLAHLAGNWEIFGLNILNMQKGLMLVLGFALIGVMLIFGFWFSLRTFLSKYQWNKWYTSFVKGQERIGWMFKLTMTCFVLGSLPYVADLLGNAYSNMMATASGSTLFGAAVGIWQYMKARKNEKSEGASSTILIYAGAFALFYGVILFAYIFATKIFLHNPLDGNNLFYSFKHLNWFLVLVGLTFIFGFFVNLNALGPHFIWRSRLMEAFMPNKDAVAKNVWQPATEADGAMMKDMCWKNEFKPGDDIANKCKRPYHIVNTNAILSNSKEVKYAGRGGDNFIISPLYCGCDATGWRKTSDFQNNKHTSKGIGLASAMATSAAALNPGAGVSGEGVTRNAVVSMLMSMLNLRLGYWTRNPKSGKMLGSPNFLVPGLVSEIFRMGFMEENDNLLLSDGGHFENLSIYELIRRKCGLIIVSDGGEDHKFNFDDLANSIEKVRVDFGARIKFMDDNKVDDILPGSMGDDLFQKKYDIAKRGYAFADITYHSATGEKQTGKLVYIKLAMIEGLATDVYSYKGVNPTFPHESTADQFFNEKQFEAYRELGYYVAWQMMLSKQGKLLFPGKEKPRMIVNNRFKISPDVHSREINLRINDTGEQPIVINYPVNIDEVGNAVAAEISNRYKAIKEILCTDNSEKIDWPINGTAEADIENLTYRFSYETKKFPEAVLADEVHFYVKLLDDKNGTIWHSNVVLSVG